MTTLRRTQIYVRRMAWWLLELVVIVLMYPALLFMSRTQVDKLLRPIRRRYATSYP